MLRLFFNRQVSLLLHAANTLSPGGRVGEVLKITPPKRRASGHLPHLFPSFFASAVHAWEVSVTSCPTLQRRNRLPGPGDSPKITHLPCPQAKPGALTAGLSTSLLCSPLLGCQESYLPPGIPPFWLATGRIARRRGTNGLGATAFCCPRFALGGIPH